jgi:hypothetical protein
MKPWMIIFLVATIAACSAAQPVVFSDPSFNPATLKRMVLVIEDRSGLGDLTKNPALMRATASNVVSALVAKGYDVTSDGTQGANSHVLLARVEPVQTSKRYIPHPVTVRKLPVSCEILTGDTNQQLRRVVVDGYRPHSARTAASWINDPSKLYPIAIQDACEQALDGIPGML